jgi:hypothetical protein
VSEFHLDDRVKWTSQSASFVREKEGRIAQVVPRGGTPEGVRKPGSARDHESYVVRVKGRGLYWPRVSKLSLSAAAPPPRDEGLTGPLAFEAMLNGVACRHYVSDEKGPLMPETMVCVRCADGVFAGERARADAAESALAALRREVERLAEGYSAEAKWIARHRETLGPRSRVAAGLQAGFARALRRALSPPPTPEDPTR